MIKAHKTTINQDIKILSSGTDSLYLFLEVGTAIDWPEMVRALENVQPGEIFYFKGLELLRVDRYFRNFPNCAQFQQIQIFFNKGAAFIQFLSLAFVLDGLEKTLEKLYSVLDQLRGVGDRFPWCEKLKINRIDTYIDFNYEGDFAHGMFRTKLINSGQFQSSDTGSKTLYFGSRSRFLIRMYIKSFEVHVSGKTYLKSDWQERGCTDNAKIWRVEFEFHKNKLDEILKDRTIENFNNETVMMLLSYGVNEFEAVENGSDSNMTRKKLHPVWIELQKGFKSDYRIQRKYINAANIEYRYKRARSWMRSLMIAEGRDFEQIPENIRIMFKFDSATYAKDLDKYNKFLVKK